MVVMKQKDYESAKKKANDDGNDEESGKKIKETVMEFMNAVMEIMTLVEIMKNTMPMKIMIRGMIRRMVVMKKKKMMS